MTKIVENVITKALNNEEGFAKVNGRMSLGFGEVGELEEKYSARIESGILYFKHWGTVTLEVHIANKEVLYFYGESNSDRDSMNCVMGLLDMEDRFAYRPVNGGFMKVN